MIKYNSLYIVSISVYAFLINWISGNLGVMPIDTFSFFDTGYSILHGKYPIREHIWGTQVLPLPPQGPEEASPIFIPPSVRMLNLEELRAAALEEDRRRSGQRKLRGKPGIGDKGAALLAKLNVMPKPPPSTVIWNKGYIGRNHNRPELFNN